jgi:hypothetical protein
MAGKRVLTLDKAAVRTFSSIPAPVRNTLTPDNGKKFAGHQSLSQALATGIYFAHPCHSWERSLTDIPTTYQTVPTKFFRHKIRTSKNPASYGKENESVSNAVDVRRSGFEFPV